MIKLVFCVRRRAELTAELFQAYWLESDANLVRSVRDQIPSMVRYVQSHTMFDAVTDAVRASRGAGVSRVLPIRRLAAWCRGDVHVVIVAVTRALRTARRVVRAAPDRIL